jgi:pyruvyltransferase
MGIRTFFWHDRVISKLTYIIKKLTLGDTHKYFLIGNSGDIIVEDIIRFKYGLESINIKTTGRRLLCVGSISHRILPGDIICGIGTKGNLLPKASNTPCKIFGLRGPLTYDLYKKSGYDVSDVKFLKDPGLMIRFLVENIEKSPEAEKIIFIPHYRERHLYNRLPKGIELVDIDCHPLHLANCIQSASLVFSSSLHGVIFSHALDRPCVLVRPHTNEPIIKYKDYFASVNLKFPKLLEDIHDVDFKKCPNSPPSLKYTLEDFFFPTIDFLKEQGITEGVMGH